MAKSTCTGFCWAVLSCQQQAHARLCITTAHDTITCCTRNGQYSSSPVASLISTSSSSSSSSDSYWR